MSRRTRILAFGTAGLFVAAGAVCATFVSGLTGQLLTIVLISLGLGAVVLLVFLEVGLSEDRERAREEASRRKRATPRTNTAQRWTSSRSRWPRRPG